MKTNNQTLKRKIAASIFALTAVTAVHIPAQAGEAAEELTKEQGFTLGGSTFFGALAGGPPGAIAGFIAGALMNETHNAQDQLATAEIDMQKVLNEITLLENEMQRMEQNLAVMEEESIRLQENLLTRLEFQMMFRTGDDQITEVDAERIAILVNYLKRNPELRVRLDGHADHRGTDEYNNLLALYRAKTVKEALVAGGIEESRIQTFSHGASMASSTEGDYEGYALDRRVNIEVFDPKGDSKNLATLN